MYKSTIKYKIFGIERVMENDNITHKLKSISTEVFDSIISADSFLNRNKDFLQEDIEVVILPYIKITKKKNKSF